MRGPRFLVVDVSNSFTKYSWSTAARLGAVHRHPTPRVSAAWLRGLLKEQRADEVYVSSVVPRCTELLARVAGSRLALLHGEADLGLPINYPKPRQIGADRLANALAARAFFGAPSIVLDFGTAVTFDILNEQGAYAGGVIAPGLNVMTDYLHERTALLPRVTLQEPASAIGKSTKEAILAGAMIGYRGLIREILQAIRRELQTCAPVRVVATGGQARLVTAKLSEVEAVRDHLTLEGLRLWANYRAVKR